MAEIRLRPASEPPTWNDAERIARHRAMSPARRWKLTVEASRAALRFAGGRRLDDRRADL